MLTTRWHYSRFISCILLFILLLNHNGGSTFFYFTGSKYDGFHNCNMARATRYHDPQTCSKRAFHGTCSQPAQARVEADLNALQNPEYRRAIKQRSDTAFSISLLSNFVRQDLSKHLGFLQPQTYGKPWRFLIPHPLVVDGRDFADSTLRALHRRSQSWAGQNTFERLTATFLNRITILLLATGQKVLLGPHFSRFLYYTAHKFQATAELTCCS